jgi:hypothetical protein
MTPFFHALRLALFIDVVRSFSAGGVRGLAVRSASSRPATSFTPEDEVARMRSYAATLRAEAEELEAQMMKTAVMTRWQAAEVTSPCLVVPLPLS